MKPEIASSLAKNRLRSISPFFLWIPNPKTGPFISLEIFFFFIETVYIFGTTVSIKLDEIEKPDRRLHEPPGDKRDKRRLLELLDRMD